MALMRNPPMCGNDSYIVYEHCDIICSFDRNFDCGKCPFVSAIKCNKMKPSVYNVYYELLIKQLKLYP